LETFLDLCLELEYVAIERIKSLQEDTEILGRKINALQSSLRNKIKTK